MFDEEAATLTLNARDGVSGSELWSWPIPQDNVRLDFAQICEVYAAPQRTALVDCVSASGTMYWVGEEGELASFEGHNVVDVNDAEFYLSTNGGGQAHFAHIVRLDADGNPLEFVRGDEDLFVASSSGYYGGVSAWLHVVPFQLRITQHDGSGAGQLYDLELDEDTFYRFDSFRLFAGPERVGLVSRSDGQLRTFNEAGEELLTLDGSYTSAAFDLDGSLLAVERDEVNDKRVIGLYDPDGEPTGVTAFGGAYEPTSIARHGDLFVISVRGDERNGLLIVR